MLKMFEIYRPGEWGKWIRKPTPSPSAIQEFLEDIPLHTKYIHVEKPISGNTFCQVRFFDMREERDEFVGFIFEASLTHDIVGVCRDTDPRGANLMLVLGQSENYKTNIDASIIDCILKQYDKAGFRKRSIDKRKGNVI